jgi:RNA recognition motif-containing protein
MNKIGVKMNIHVSNLSRETAESDLREAFEGHGQVSSVNIIKDKHSGESKGFGFVEMPTKVQAEAALAGLHGTTLNGRTLSLSEARPRAAAYSDSDSRNW